ncbi:MAG: archaeosortase A [Methanomicrobiales archaeon]|nr:archaeosortase A [Methanomicrobiales archaeon]
MSGLIIAFALIAFLLALVPGPHRKYAAIGGWACIVLNLFSEVPAFVSEANFLYPALALLSVPFMAVTTKELLQENPVALRLTCSAAIAAVLFVPFALVPLLSYTLITAVISTVFAIVTALGHQPFMVTWDIMAEHAFYNQIILGCTGILAIALITGILAMVPDATPVRRLAVILPVAALLFVLNLIRVAAVFIAVSDQWFTGWPDPTGTGDANFFWAHNVFAEGLAILFLLVLIAALVRVLPGLGTYARDTAALYIQGIRSFGDWRKTG